MVSKGSVRWLNSAQRRNRPLTVEGDVVAAAVGDSEMWRVVVRYKGDQGGGGMTGGESGAHGSELLL